MKRIAIVSVVVAVLTASAWLVWAVRRDRRLGSFNRVSVGMSETEVTGMLGAPNRVGPCSDLFKPFPANENCARQFVYTSPFPLIPEYYLVRFDSLGRVKSTDEYDSP